MTPYDELLARVESLEGGVSLSQLPLGQLRSALFENGEPLDLSTMALAGQVVNFGKDGVKVRWGTSAVVFSAADASAQVAIPHGMGSVPVLGAGFAATPAAARLTIQETQAPDNQKIYLTGFQSAGTAITATQNIYWLAIG